MVFVVRNPISGTSRAIRATTDGVVVTIPDGMVNGAAMPSRASPVPSRRFTMVVRKETIVSLFPCSRPRDRCDLRGSPVMGFVTLFYKEDFFSNMLEGRGLFSRV